MTKSKEDVITGVLNEATGRTQQLLEKSVRLVQELGDIAQGNAEAIVVSSKAAASGFQALGADATECGRKNFEAASLALKSVTSVKTPVDFFQIQAELARSVFGNLVAQSSKFSDSIVELGGQVATPLANRYVAAAERVKVATLEQ